jgi:hypothetical protein
MFLMMDTASPPPWQPQFSHDVGAFREWMAEHEQLVNVQGRPVWRDLIIQGGWLCLDELLAADTREHDALLDWTDRNGHGWLWVGLSFQAPARQLLAGLERLAPGWDASDWLGHDPLLLAQEGQRIQGLARRLWRDDPLAFPKRAAALAGKAHTPAAQRAWHFWAQGLNSSQ